MVSHSFDSPEWLYDAKFNSVGFITAERIIIGRYELLGLAGYCSTANMGIGSGEKAHGTDMSPPHRWASTSHSILPHPFFGSGQAERTFVRVSLALMAVEDVRQTKGHAYQCNDNSQT